MKRVLWPVFSENFIFSFYIRLRNLHISFLVVPRIETEKLKSNMRHLFVSLSECRMWQTGCIQHLCWQGVGLLSTIVANILITSPLNCSPCFKNCFSTIRAKQSIYAKRTGQSLNIESYCRCIAITLILCAFVIACTCDYTRFPFNQFLYFQILYIYTLCKHYLVYRLMPAKNLSLHHITMATTLAHLTTVAFYFRQVHYHLFDLSILRPQGAVFPRFFSRKAMPKIKIN